MAVAAEGRMACVSGLHGPQAPAVPPDLVEAWGVPEGSHQELQVGREVAVQAEARCNRLLLRAWACSGSVAMLTWERMVQEGGATSSGSAGAWAGRLP